jgi:enoyl-CoA hydratase/carnithine racemase
LPAEHGLAWILPRLVGAGRAADLLLSGRIVLAEEAVELGLVNWVLPPDELLPTALAYAAEMAATCSPSALAVIKRQLWSDLTGDVGPAVAESERLLLQMIKEPDFAEGVAAQREKRPPRFTPR